MRGVGLVATFLNEEKSLPEFLDSALAQTRPPQEIILVDGGSTDRSCEIIRHHIARGAPITLLELQGANRSQGRNAGIRHCRQEIVAMTDVGCRLQPDWLEKIVAPLERGEVEVAGGYYVPLGRKLFERAVAAAIVPLAREVNPDTFLPSSRSIAFLKESWEKAGGYPEWTSWNEDTVFDIALKEAGARFRFVPDALVAWRQQGDYGNLFIQFYRYAYGDALARLYFPHYRKGFLFLAVWLACAIMCLIAFIGHHPREVFTSIPAVTLVILIILLISGYDLRYIIRSRKRGWDWPAAVLSPLAMFVVDMANCYGYLAGAMNRAKIKKDQ